MSYALVQDVAASWHDYQRISATAFEPVPAGLILHIAGPTDDGFRIIEVWESETAWKRFRAERLVPAITGFDGPARPQPRFRDLRARHLVLGSALAMPAPRGPNDGFAGRLDNGAA
jgi:hypothetical protein